MTHAEGAKRTLDPQVESGVPQVSSAIWSVIGRLGAQVLQLAGFVALAHLVQPGQFGVAAVAAVIVGISQMLSDLGVGPAIVAEAQPSAAYLSTAFWLNAASGVVLGVLVAPLGIALATAFGLPDLRWVLPVMSLSVVLSVSPVSIALLERRLQFVHIAVIDIGSVLCGQAAAVVLAWAGHPLLGLAALPVVTSFALSALSIVAARWLPRLEFSRTALARLRRYALPLAVFNVITYCARNVDNLIVGSVFGARALGLYSRAYLLMLAPMQQINWALGRVLQVSFARYVTSAERLELMYRKVLRLIALIAFAAAAVVACTADDLVAVVFGAQWRPMGYLLRVLGIAIGAQALIGLAGVLLRATGQTRLLLGLGTITTALELGSIGVAAFWSVRAVVWAYTAASFLALPLMICFVCARLGFSLTHTGREIVAALPAPAALALFLLVPRVVGGSWSAGSRLALQIVLISAACPYFARSARRLLRSRQQ